jgi:cyanate permease
MSLICAIVSMVVLTLYQYAISNYEEQLDNLDETQKTKKFWGEANVFVQGILLSLINVGFEVIFEYLVEFEKWETLPNFHLQKMLRLTNLEFFVTALVTPVILALVMAGS